MYLKLKSILIWIFVFLFSLSLPFQLGKHYFFPFSYLSGIRIDYLAPTLYLTDILSLPFLFVSIYLLYKQRDKIVQFVQKNIYIVFLSFFLICINYYFSLSKEIWFYSLVKTIQWLLLFYFFYQEGNKKYIYSAVLFGLLCGSILEFALSFQQLVVRHSLQGLWYYLGERRFFITTPGIAKAYLFGKEFLRPYGTFSHPNSLGGFYLFIYIFTLTQNKITNQSFKILLLSLSSFLILLSFSRSVLVIYGVLNLIYFSRFFVQCKLCSLAKIVLMIFLFFIAINISGDRNSMDKRTDFVQKSINIISHKPLSGTGVGSYLIAQHQYPQKFSSFFEQPVHNIFLLAIAQIGVPLSLLLFTMIIRIIIVKIKSSPFLLPFLCVFLTGGIDHYWITLQQNVLVTAMIFGILMVYEKKTTRT